MQILEFENYLPLQQFSHHQFDNSSVDALENKSSKSDKTIKDDSEIQYSDDSILHLNKKPSKNSLKSASILKKKVRFADDCGQDLAIIRVMKEPSDFPPKINPAILRRYRKAAVMFAFMKRKTNNNILSSVDEISDNEDDDDVDVDEIDANKNHATWKINFIQPVSDYTKFRETLEKNKIALENVILRNDKMLGTIKVANLSYEKRVFLRLTSNSWQSFVDIPANFHSSPSNSFDIFAFEIGIPMYDIDVTKLEFCFYYIDGGGREYWDSNNGKNYSLIFSNSQKL